MSPEYLFPPRTIAIMAFALVALVVVAGLTYVMDQSWPAAVLAGLAAFGVVIVGLHKIVGP